MRERPRAGHVRIGGVTDDRSLSDVIGYVLVFSIVAITIGIVSVAGVSTLQNAKDVEQTRNVERAFDVLADNLEDLRIAGAPNRATEVSLNEATLDTATTATVNLTGWNGAGSNFTAEATSDVIAWQSTRGSPTRIVYAFGTVLRSQRDGGIITRAGPFQFDTDRTIVPLVQTRTRSAQSLGGGTIRVRAGRSVPTIQHRGDASMYSNLWLNVTTSHAHTWHQYLDDQTGTNCSIRAGPGSKETVTCELDGRDELYVTIHPVNIELER